MNPPGMEEEPCEYCTPVKVCHKHCPNCEQWVKREDDIHRLARDNRDIDRLYGIVLAGYKACNVHGPKYKNNRGANGRPKGVFAGTLTMSDTDEFTQTDMITSIKKVMNYKQSNVKKYAWYLEFTEKGLPHIHFIYETETGGRIKAQLFSRAWPIWNENKPVGVGHRGGYHKNVADVDAYRAYIKKDGSDFSENKWES